MPTKKKKKIHAHYKMICQDQSKWNNESYSNHNDVDDFHLNVNF